MEKLKLTETDYAALARLLRRVDFFAPMTVGQLETFLPYVMLYTYRKGDTVFRQGDAGDAFYIVYDGKVDIHVKKGLFSFKRTVATMGPGDFFGEMALVSHAPRTATVVCSEPTRLFVLLAVDFEAVLRQNPSFKAEMDKVTARRRFDSEH